jgi:hypothetical protein
VRCRVGCARNPHHGHRPSTEKQCSESSECSQGGILDAFFYRCVQFSGVCVKHHPRLTFHVRQAFEALRSNRSCSAELLSNPRPIAACNRVAIASVLDDIHRLFFLLRTINKPASDTPCLAYRAAFGMPVRSCKKMSERGSPFLGVWLAQKQQQVRDVHPCAEFERTR